jgi:hypothetical protein
MTTFKARFSLVGNTIDDEVNKCRCRHCKFNLSLPGDRWVVKIVNSYETN